MGTPPAPWPLARGAGAVVGRREGSANYDIFASANSIKLRIVALHSFILSATGRKSSSISARAIASVAVRGTFDHEDRDVARLLAEPAGAALRSY